MYPLPLSPLVSGAYTPLTPASLRMLPCRAHWPRPSISIMYGCGTVCEITLFARYCLVILPPKVGFGAPTADGFFFKRCAAGRRARLDGPSGRSLALGICPWRASHAGIRGYGPRRPLEARVISARSRPRPRSPCFGTIRLWYDIAVFVAVLSFHSARYRSGYGPRRPLEARVISARSRDLDLGSTASLTPITVLCLWYHTTLV